MIIVSHNNLAERTPNYLTNRGSKSSHQLTTFFQPHDITVSSQVLVIISRKIHTVKSVIKANIREQGRCKTVAGAPFGESRARRHVWVEFVVGSSCSCSEAFSSSSSVFLLLHTGKTNTANFQLDLETVEMNEHSLNLSMLSISICRYGGYLVLFLLKSQETLLASGIYYHL